MFNSKHNRSEIQNESSFRRQIDLIHFIEYYLYSMSSEISIGCEKTVKKLRKHEFPLQSYHFISKLLAVTANLIYIK